MTFQQLVCLLHAHYTCCKKNKLCIHMIVSLHLMYEYVHLYDAEVKNNRYTGQLSMNLFWNSWKPFHAFSGAQGYPLLLYVCVVDR